MIRYFTAFALWLALARSADGYVLALGAVVVAATLLAVRRMVPADGGRRRSPWAAIAGTAAFAASLLVRFVTSTLLTSAMILFQREVGRVVIVPLRLRDPGRRFLLLNAITLTPSTISLLLEEDLLYVHWLLPHGRAADVRKVKDALERPLIFGEKADDARGD
ncbi:MAG: Na+/H+ antiporter subunit E [Candidatus Bipolaricaulota bacterium]|nr:MAG: Na+/H+ antiporter subunit E [Candidatus Bipolaricaulota bacterium]